MSWYRRSFALLAQRCPVCLTGRMFCGIVEMNEQCPVCGHQFLREPGFFQGAMYVSYFVGVLEFAVLALLASFLLGPWLGTGAALIVAAVVHLALVPMLFRYSRVIWSHVNVGTGARSEGR